MVTYFENCRSPLLPIREYTLMGLVNTITDKLDWQRKVLDDTIVAQWRSEVLKDRGSKRLADSSAVEVSPKMVDWAIAEVNYKAKLSTEIDCIEALDGIWKSDTIVKEELRRALMKAVQPLEDVPEVRLSPLYLSEVLRL